VKDTDTMIEVLKARQIVRIGLAMMNFLLPNDAGKGPSFITRRHNPHKATTETMAQVRKQFEASMGGIVRDNPDWAIVLGVKLAWIANLEEIRKYDPKDGGTIPDIVWTEESKKEIADVFNGNHHYKLLLADYAGALKQYDTVQRRMKAFQEKEKPSSAHKKQAKEDQGLFKQLRETLEDKGQFVVELVDLGMSIQLR
jgi:hypothetical protein